MIYLAMAAEDTKSFDFVRYCYNGIAFLHFSKISQQDADSMQNDIFDD